MVRALVLHAIGLFRRDWKLAVGQFIAAPRSGALVDRFGARRVIVTGLTNKLYNAAGTTLLGTGNVLPDGRNQSVVVTGLAAGGSF